MNFVTTIDSKNSKFIVLYRHCFIINQILKCYVINIFRDSIYFVNSDCYFSLLSVTILTLLYLTTTWTLQHRLILLVFNACTYVFISKMWHVLYLICKYFDCFFFYLIYVTQILTCSISYGIWRRVAGLNEQNKQINKNKTDPMDQMNAK